MHSKVVGAGAAVVALSLLATSAHAHGSPNLLESGCNSRGAALAKRQVLTSGEGSAPSGSGGASAAKYSCDPNQCKLPKCRCADTNPPGNLAIADVPMFITLTADDAIQSYTINAMNSLIGSRKNPNGCPARATYFTSLSYTNYSMVTEWYVAGNEIADHTMTHVGSPPQEEISGNLVALNALAGIPYKEIQGFRAPFLNYTRETLETLAKMNFTYDSSASSGVRTTDSNTDAFWPYTLDYGMANDCTAVSNICAGEPKLPGFWEIPMYSTFDVKSANGAHLMDPWLDGKPDDVNQWLRDTFNDHYNGKKQPMGLYSHPIHIASGYPGLVDPVDTVKMLNSFLDWATIQHDNVWLVSNEQLLAWMKNPVKASELNTLDEFKCQTPSVSAKICNGMPSNEAGLLQHCISNTPGDPLNNSPFYTCYGCPSTTPSPGQPNPPQKNTDGSVRSRISASCDTPFWDPIAGKCLNSGFTDDTRAIGPNGANVAASGGTNTNGSESAGATASTDPFKSFNGAVSAAPLWAGLITLVAMASSFVAVFV
ncbi:unnamed protein product [Parajaminaea phylloscopi]